MPVDVIISPAGLDFEKMSPLAAELASRFEVRHWISIFAYTTILSSAARYN
jgi:hypothetical protein